MSEFNAAEIESSASQLKFYLAIKEIEKRGLLQDLIEQMNVASVVRGYGPKNSELAVRDSILTFNSESMRAIVKNHPDVIDDILKKIDSQDLTEELSGADLTIDQLNADTVEYLKTVKFFESEFPDDQQVLLKERIISAKNLISDALSSDKGKVVLNAVLLGVAVGTGGAGVIAGAKLLHSVANMAMKNPSVSRLFDRVQEKAYDFLSNSGVPVEKIQAGKDLVVRAISDQVEKRSWLKSRALPLLLMGGAIGSVLLYQNFDSAKDLVSMALDGDLPGGDAVSKTLGFSPEVPDSVAGAQSEGLDIPKSSGNDSSISVPEGNAEHVSEGKPSAALDAVQIAQETTGYHTVVKNDSIWNITKGLLPEGATNQEIYKGVQAFIDANPNVASHPNLIFPGDELKIPDYLNPEIKADLVSEVRGVEDIKIDAPVISPVVPELSLNEVRIEPNNQAPIMIPDAAVTMASEGKDVVKSVAKGSVGPSISL